MDKRPHGDMDKIIERSRAGYCLTHSEVVHLCDHAERLRAALLAMIAAYAPGFHTLDNTTYNSAVEALERCHPKLTVK
jgi:hypothetical protein